jgi:hypothetical protein
LVNQEKNTDNPSDQTGPAVVLTVTAIFPKPISSPIQQIARLVELCTDVDRSRAMARQSGRECKVEQASGPNMGLGASISKLPQKFW